MDNQTACAIISASEMASDLRKEFICTYDGLHQSMLKSPLPVLLFVMGVFLVMFLVQRAANIPHHQTSSTKSGKNKENTDSKS
jgi:hypothetical protein